MKTKRVLSPERRGADHAAAADRRLQRHRQARRLRRLRGRARPGTTEDFGDAWFVGFTREMTIAVWVGYPDKLTPMKTEFDGEPVAGGTFPAQIWRDFVVQAGAIAKQRIAERQAKREGKEAPDADRPARRARATPVTGGSGGDGDAARTAATRGDTAKPQVRRRRHRRRRR